MAIRNGMWACGAMLMCVWGATAPAARGQDSGLGQWLDDLTGFVRVRHYEPVERDGDSQQSYEARIGWPMQFQDGGSAAISAHARLDYGFEMDEPGSPGRRLLELYEAYVDHEWGWLQVRAGRQFIRWGKGDEVNPVDNFTPEDLTEGINLDRADRKTPAWAVYPKLQLGEGWTWGVLWQPVFAANEIGGQGEVWEPYISRYYRGIGLPVLDDDPPDRVGEDSVWATRLGYQGLFGDISASYAYHFEETAAFRVEPNPTYRPGAPMAPAVVRPIHERVHSVGTDFETAFSGWGIREEAVFTTGRPYVNKDPTDPDAIEEKDTISVLIGADYTYESDTYFNVQLIQDFILDYIDTLQPKEYQASVTFRVWQFFLHQKLKLQVTGRAFVTNPDWFWKTNMEYEFSDNLKIDAGFMAFGGEDEGLFGQFAENDQLYALAKYSF